MGNIEKVEDGEGRETRRVGGACRGMWSRCGRWEWPVGRATASDVSGKAPISLGELARLHTWSTAHTSAARLFQPAGLRRVTRNTVLLIDTTHAPVNSPLVHHSLLYVHLPPVRQPLLPTWHSVIISARATRVSSDTWPIPNSACTVPSLNGINSAILPFLP